MELITPKYKIRPHHGLCMLFFEGKGYNEEFTNHMAAVIEKINDLDVIELVCEVDVVCAKCPNNNNLVCTSNDKVTEYDNGVLKHCSLNQNELITFGDYKRLLYQRVLSLDKLYSICGNCQWVNICQAKCKDKQFLQDRFIMNEVYSRT